MEVIAHRGASAYRREHTAAAYDLALAQGADALELDVRATADGALVVVHDATLLRTAGRPLRIARTTLADLRAACGLRAPLTLEAVLDRYGRGTRYLVELKDPTPAWEQRVAETLLGRGVASHATVQSFDVLALRRLREQAPWLDLAALCRRRPGPRTMAAMARCCSAIGVWHRFVDASLVGAAAARHLRVRAWTVNTPDAIARVAAAGVDGVITDVPDVATAVIGRSPAVPVAA